MKSPDAPSISSLDLTTLRRRYGEGESPSTIVEEVLARAEGAQNDGAWITVASRPRLLAAARALEERRARGEDLPLYGVPFAVKDNIDVAGLPTTAACPAFAYTPDAHAPVVERLVAAGALPV